ncbi:hypothetical protein SNEBB_009959 [Seison nebaliae]|nr:hypothetical protein SNEBB_009959 [Seison nebaliae]
MYLLYFTNILIIFFIIIQLSYAIYFVYQTKKFLFEGIFMLDNQMESKNDRMWHSLQVNLQCCGIMNAGDWSWVGARKYIPPSCCKVYQEDCAYYGAKQISLIIGTQDLINENCNILQIYSNVNLNGCNDKLVWFFQICSGLLACIVTVNSFWLIGYVVSIFNLTLNIKYKFEHFYNKFG